MNKKGCRRLKYKEVHPASLSEFSRDWERRTNVLGFFCGTKLPPETGTTTSEHPVDFSTSVSLQPTNERYLYPTGKSPITFWVSSHPLAFSLNISSPLLLQAFFTLSTAYTNCSSSSTAYSFYQVISSLFPGLMLELVRAGEFFTADPPSVWLYKALEILIQSIT